MKKKQIKQIDFTINDSCLVCDVKTDGSVLCNNCSCCEKCGKLKEGRQHICPNDGTEYGDEIEKTTRRTSK